MIPLVVYLLVVFVRVKEKIGNYNDWTCRNERDEKLKLKEIDNEMAERGMVYSSFRQETEKKAKEDFEFERREKKRKHLVDLVDSLFLR